MVMGESGRNGDAPANTAANRFGRNPEELAETRARIADAEERAKRGELPDSTAWARRKLEEEKRRLAAK